MSDKDKEDGDDGDNDSKKKDGKGHKFKLGKRLRSSFKRAACLGGSKTLDGDMDEEDPDGTATRVPPGSILPGNELVPIRARHSINYGTSKPEEDDKMLNELLGEAEKKEKEKELSIDIINDNDKDDYFPEEKNKTIIALVVLCICFLLNTISLVLTHERMQLKRKPLPDIFLDNVPTVDDALYIGEICIMISSFSTVILMTLHKYRWIVFRRCFTILGLLYLVRALTMYVTVLPVASYTYHCDPKMNSSSFGEGALRVLKLASGFGLSINGRHTYCGDYIYSGHTVILVMAALVIQEYSPRGNWVWSALHWTYWLISLTGVLLVMIARGHYTIDVLIAYYITTRAFWIYHMLANRSELKSHSDTNYLSRVFWFRYFIWLEGSIRGVLPRHYSIPYTNEFVEFEDEDND